jgi:phage tail sheath protein FI
MSVRPGISVVQRSTPSPRTFPTDRGVWFVAGLADEGPVEPTVIRSMADYERIFGARVSYSILYDALDTYFRDGGESAYISRVVGPGAVVATHNLMDTAGTPAVSLVATALGPGAYGNNINVGVRAGGAAGTFQVFVVIGADEVETSYDLPSQAAAVNWALRSDYIRLALGVSTLNPTVAAASALATGADDRASITDAQWQVALDRFTDDYGIGQVSAPGRTTGNGATQVLAHAAAHRRTALLDAPDTGVKATLKGAANTARAGDEIYGGMFAPWVIVPGVIAGTTRSVPPSAMIAGILARNDGNGLGADDPAAGENGISRFAIGLAQEPWSDVDRQELNEGGINVIRTLFGSIRNYGWRSLADPADNQDWLDLGHARLYMAIAGEGAAIAETFLFDKIDGQGRTVARFGGALGAMLQRYWLNGDLYGLTAPEAYYVDVGSSVNTPETLEANELHAVLNVRFSPFAEFVVIEIVKRPITEAVV